MSKCLRPCFPEISRLGGGGQVASPSREPPAHTRQLKGETQKMRPKKGHMA